MNRPKWAIPRRTFLKGLGSTIYLPFLEAMLPFTQDAQADVASVPPRMIYLWFDLGVYRTDWVPSGTGQAWTLPSILSPLAAHKNDIMMLRRVRNWYGDSHNTGGGDHARSIGTFLNCAHARYFTGHSSADFGLPNNPEARFNHQGPKTTAGFAAWQAQAYPNKIPGSVDQIAAELAWNNNYRLKSVQMRRGGGGDSHHNDVNRHLSWTAYNRPAPRMEDLHTLFDAIFQNRPNQQAPVRSPAAIAQDQSILDSVLPAVDRLNQKLGKEDQLRIDQYLTEIREIERKVNADRLVSSTQPAQCTLQLNERPGSSNPRFDQHIRTTLDLMIKAFQCDITRVFTHGWHYGSFSFLTDAEGRALNLEPHNNYSHHSDRPQSREGLRRINRLWAEIFADFLAKMKSTPDFRGGTLLDHSQILFGCGMMDGNRHDSAGSSTELPIILAGRASGMWTPGKLVDTGSEIRLANIHLNMLRNMGYQGTRFGDSNNVSLNL